jgi:hypothetical protein
MLRHPHCTATRQRGATLVIGLVLLLVLTVLAVATMNSATFGLNMAGNLQYSETAFQVAETGVEVAINAGPFNDIVPTDIPATELADLEGIDVGVFDSIAQFQLCGGMPAGASTGVGEDAYSSYHFQITSTGTAARGATTTLTQDFSLMGPGCL